MSARRVVGIELLETIACELDGAANDIEAWTAKGGLPMSVREGLNPTWTPESWRADAISRAHGMRQAAGIVRHHAFTAPHYRLGWRGWLDNGPLARLLMAFSAHRLVHNGPLWWACRDCRALRPFRTD